MEATLTFNRTLPPEQYQLHIAPYSHRFRFHSSSTIVPMALPTVCGIYDPEDAAITVRLLSQTGCPRRRSSHSGLSSSQHEYDVSSGQPDGLHMNMDGGHCRMIQSSNTWTSSSGEILSDQDDIEDRSSVVEEYNRLAKKVGAPISISFSWTDVSLAGRPAIDFR